MAAAGKRITSWSALPPTTGALPQAARALSAACSYSPSSLRGRGKLTASHEVRSARWREGLPAFAPSCRSPAGRRPRAVPSSPRRVQKRGRTVRTTAWFGDLFSWAFQQQQEHEREQADMRARTEQNWRDAARYQEEAKRYQEEAERIREETKQRDRDWEEIRRRMGWDKQPASTAARAKPAIANPSETRQRRAPGPRPAPLVWPKVEGASGAPTTADARQAAAECSAAAAQAWARTASGREAATEAAAERAASTPAAQHTAAAEEWEWAAAAWHAAHEALEAAQQACPDSPAVREAETAVAAARALSAQRRALRGG